MKRWLLPASALVLVVTACGAGAKPAPRVTAVGARTPSIHAVAAHRRRAAAREAKRLLREFVPPPGARPTSQPREYGGVLRRSGPTSVGEVVDVHRFWRVHKPLPSVLAFVRAHDPHGSRRMGASYGTGKPHYLTRSLAWSSKGRRPTRYLNETVVALPGRTVIRVDAQVVWIYPRSPGERVPRATREIVVRARKTSAKVTDPAKVARIVRWFDALPVAPPGVAVLCPLTLPPDLTLSFRSAGGAWLAGARMPRTDASICDPIDFAIGGHQERPLIDSGESLVSRLERLLDLHLVHTPR
jgi:hypothetical protein